MAAGDTKHATDLILDRLAHMQGQSELRESDRSAHYQRMELDLCRAHKGGWRVHDMDLTKFLREGIRISCGDGVLDALRDKNGAGTRLRESALDAIVSSQFSDLLTTTIRLGTLEIEPLADFAILNLVDRAIRLTPNTNRLAGMHELGDLVEDPTAELEETKYKGAKMRWVQAPPATKKKFALAITREMVDLDAEGEVREMMRTGARSLQLHNEKLCVDMVFGLYQDTTQVPIAPGVKFIENGTNYGTYYLVGDNGPWTNELDANNLDGTYVPFQAVEDLRETMRDDYNGEPVVVDGMQIIVTNGAQKKLAMDGLGAMLLARDSGGAGNERQEIVRAPNPEFNATSIVLARYAWDRLLQWYQSTDGGANNAANAALATGRTWIVGNITRAFGLGTQWEPETIERGGTDTEAYFAQEILFRIKYMEKSTPVVKNPRYVVANRDLSPV